MRFKIVTDFFKTTRLHDNKTTSFSVTEFVDVPNTSLRQTQAPVVIKS